MAQPHRYRTCIGCGMAKHKNDLLRIVKQQDNSLEIDFQQKLPGRGAYLCKKLECARQAFQRRGLDRSFRTPVASQFYEHLIQQMERHE